MMLPNGKAAPTEKEIKETDHMCKMLIREMQHLEKKEIIIVCRAIEKLREGQW